VQVETAFVTFIKFVDGLYRSASRTAAYITVAFSEKEYQKIYQGFCLVQTKRKNVAVVLHHCAQIVLLVIVIQYRETPQPPYYYPKSPSHATRTATARKSSVVRF